MYPNISRIRDSKWDTTNFKRSNFASLIVLTILFLLSQTVKAEVDRPASPVSGAAVAGLTITAITESGFGQTKEDEKRRLNDAKLAARLFSAAGKIRDFEISNGKVDNDALKEFRRMSERLPGERVVQLLEKIAANKIAFTSTNISDAFTVDFEIETLKRAAAKTKKNERKLKPSGVAPESKANWTPENWFENHTPASEETRRIYNALQLPENLRRKQIISERLMRAVQQTPRWCSAGKRTEMSRRASETVLLWAGKRYDTCGKEAIDFMDAALVGFSEDEFSDVEATINGMYTVLKDPKSFGDDLDVFFHCGRR